MTPTWPPTWDLENVGNCWPEGHYMVITSQFIARRHLIGTLHDAFKTCTTALTPSTRDVKNLKAKYSTKKVGTSTTNKIRHPNGGDYRGGLFNKTFRLSWTQQSVRMTLTLCMFLNTFNLTCTRRIGWHSIWFGIWTRQHLKLFVPFSSVTKKNGNLILIID